jgi:hypothetical protein
MGFSKKLKKARKKWKKQTGRDHENTRPTDGSGLSEAVKDVSLSGKLADELNIGHVDQRDKHYEQKEDEKRRAKRRKRKAENTVLSDPMSDEDERRKQNERRLAKTKSSGRSSTALDIGSNKLG